MKIIITLCFVLGVGIVAILIYTYGIKLRVKELTKGQSEKQYKAKTPAYYLQFSVTTFRKQKPGLRCPCIFTARLHITPIGKNENSKNL